MVTETAPNALVFDSAAELLLTLGVLMVSVLLLGVLTYRRGRRTQRHWHAALTHAPVGIALFDVQRQRRVFANPIATTLLASLDLAAIIHRVAQQPHPQAWTVRHGEDGLLALQTCLLAPDSPFVMLTLSTGRQQSQDRQDRVFLQALSHELHTPLTAIQGHLASIERQTRAEQDAGWRGSLQIVQDEIARLAWLTPNVLTLLKLDAHQPLKRRLHHLGLIAEDVAQHLWDTADARGIRLQVVVQPGLERISVDRSAWKQVFLNLLDNSIKYGRDGGSIMVTLTQTPTTQCIEICDDGPGIAPADLPHLFTRLYRAEGQQHIPGSGLGLTIVRAIVAAHGGQIVCHSPRVLEQGTSFQITVPREYVDVTET
jgi:two-component system phosphate regulon sensor histidine kinase PhoR